MVALTVMSLATAPFVAGPVSSIKANREQRKARREQRTASLLEQEKAAVQNARQRRRAAAQAQVQRARVQAQESAIEGSTSSSSTNQGAITSQTAGNISFQRQLEGLSGRQIGAMNNASSLQGKAAQTQALGAIPGQLGLSAGSFLGQMSFGQMFGGGNGGFLSRNPGTQATLGYPVA